MAEGRFRRALRRFTADDEDIAAEDLRHRAEQAGATPIAESGTRERVVVYGTVQSTTLRPRAGVPALEAELYDGSGRLYVVWLGRREIAGIRTGVTLRVEGRVATAQGRRTLFNPAYTIVPDRAS